MDKGQTDKQEETLASSRDKYFIRIRFFLSEGTTKEHWWRERSFKGELHEGKMDTSRLRHTTSTAHFQIKKEINEYNPLRIHFIRKIGSSKIA